MTEPRYRIGNTEALFAVPTMFVNRSARYREAELVGAATGSRHTYLVVSALGIGGYVEHHTHSYEEAFYILEGVVELVMDTSVTTLRAGSFGLIDVGQGHSWRSTNDVGVRWVSMNSPLPIETDPTFAPGFDVASISVGGSPSPTIGRARPEALVPVSDRAIHGYKPDDMDNVSIDWLVDAKFGADLLKLFMVRYGPGGRMGRHEHPVEEFYLVLDGVVHATADDAETDLGPGDFLWTGVGCVHSFENRSKRDVIWIETQAPQPPRNHPVRFINEMTASSPRDA